MRRQPSLRSQLNQIRLWVRQGRTNAWIAHKLDVSIEQLERFKRDHDLEGDSAAAAPPADPLSVPPPEPESYMPPDEDEEEEPGAPEEADEAEEMVRPRPQRRRRPPRSRDRDGGQPEPRGGDEARERTGGRPPQADEEDEEGGQPRRSRRRGRRGGRRRRRPSTYEATFDHGEDGYGLWLDPAVVDNPVYAEHWAGQRAVVVVFDRDAITIRRAGAESPNGAEDVEPDADADGDRDDQE